MLTMQNPEQQRMFNPIKDMVSKSGYRTLVASWAGVFREIILAILPALDLSRHFSPRMGRPTKDMYAMIGLVFLKEHRNMTMEEAKEAYELHLDMQYALGIEDTQPSLCQRTLEQYVRYVREDGLAAKIMESVTAELVKQLELNVSKQRLDSTHVFSNMASFGRTRLMAVSIGNFLKEVERDDSVSYAGLPEELRQRYGPKDGDVLGTWSKDPTEREAKRQSVAEQMYWVMEHFATDEKHRERESYKVLCKVFGQQCELRQKKVVVRAKTGGDIILNPSDLGATLDGHKGAGYKVQLTETCSPDNEVQLITMAIPQTACDHDSNAMPKVLEKLKEQGLMPKEMLADTHYGSDASFLMCAEEGVRLIAPTAGKKPDENEGESVSAAKPTASTSAKSSIELPMVDAPSANAQSQNSNSDAPNQGAQAEAARTGLLTSVCGTGCTGCVARNGSVQVMACPSKELDGTGPEEPTATDSAQGTRQTPKKLTILDFTLDLEKNICTACPAGTAPDFAYYDTVREQHKIMMLSKTCRSCELRCACPIRKDEALNMIYIKDKDYRLAQRREYEKTAEFKKEYAQRSGIESTNFEVKQTTGMGHLGVRGKQAVYHAIYLKIAGANIMRACKSSTFRDRFNPDKPPDDPPRGGGGSTEGQNGDRKGDSTDKDTQSKDDKGPKDQEKGIDGPSGALPRPIEARNAPWLLLKPSISDHSTPLLLAA